MMSPKPARAGTASGASDAVESRLSKVASELRQSSTIPAQVASGLRSLILSGQLRPGERVVEWKIARQLGIGQPTAREALLLLESEGLVQRQANRGCTVTQLSVREIDQIYCVRAELEPLAAELAVANAANWEPDTLTSAMKRLAGAAENDDIEDWHQKDLEFHQTLWRLADNPFLEKALTQVSVPFFAFAELVFLRSHPRDLVHQAEQHEAIVAAVLSGDRRRARREMKRVLQEFRTVWRALTKTAAGA